MTKQEVMDEYIALVQRNNEVPTLIEFIQNTCVEPQDIAEHFCASNVVDGFIRLSAECSSYWIS